VFDLVTTQVLQGSKTEPGNPALNGSRSCPGVCYGTKPWTGNRSFRATDKETPVQTPVQVHTILTMGGHIIEEHHTRSASDRGPRDTNTQTQTAQAILPGEFRFVVRAQRRANLGAALAVFRLLHSVRRAGPDPPKPPPLPLPLPHFHRLRPSPANRWWLPARASARLCVWATAAAAVRASERAPREARRRRRRPRRVWHQPPTWHRRLPLRRRHRRRDCRHWCRRHAHPAARLARVWCGGRGRCQCWPWRMVSECRWAGGCSLGQW